MTQIHLNQKEIYFDQLLDPNNPYYNIGTYVVIKGSLNTNLLLKSLQSSSSIFDVFKFQEFSKNAPLVNISNETPPIKIYEKECLKTQVTDDEVIKWMQDRINTPFKIHEEPLYDFVLINRGNDEHWFYLGFHHLFSDGYGVPYVFLKYIFDKYFALRTGSNKTFEFPSYIDLIEKSNDYITSDDYRASETYWKDRFKVSQDPIFDKLLSKNPAKTSAIQVSFIPEEQLRLREFCKENKMSLQDLLIAALAVYYGKTKKIEYFDFCLPTHNRISRNDRKTLGLFTKLIPSRLTIADQSLKTFIEEIKLNQRQDYRHKQFPVSHFNTIINNNQNNTSAPFDICINYRYFRLETDEEELLLKGYKNDATFSKTPLEFSWCDFAENGKEDVYLEITFREDFSDQKEIEYLGQRISFIISQFYDGLNLSIKAIDVVPETERNILLNDFNNGKISVPFDQTFLDLFEKQVTLNPHEIALKQGDETYTYLQLNELSNQLVDFLKQKYVLTLDDLIGVKLARSNWSIVSLLAVMKSGCGYVPIDPGFPQLRIEQIEKECKACIGKSTIEEFVHSQKKWNKLRIDKPILPSQYAYVIYTSGSTGVPKGVVISHANLTNKLFEEKSILFTDEKLITYCSTNLVFDVSLLEILLPLAFGGTVIVPEKVEGLIDVQISLDEIISNKVNLLQGTPTYFNHFFLELEASSIERLNQTLRTICIGGESLNSQLVNRIKEFLPNVKLNNHYGPTEITIDAIVNTDIQEFESNIIGKPLGNTRIYILNHTMDLVPILVEGEIFISGPSVSQGYFDQDNLSKEKFIENPFDNGTYLYKSGDIGRWTLEGNVEFMGRNDEQVKIRGFRIELDEIAHQLTLKQDIIQSVVIAKENGKGEYELVAYVISEIQQNVSDLRFFLENILPDYMVPAHFVQVDEIPLTSNGKCDTKKLPNPEGLGLRLGTEFIAPKTELEKELVEIWKITLEKDSIGVKDNFFLLGGHSLSAVRLNNEYKTKFGVSLALRDLFANPTIAEQATLIENIKAIVVKEIPTLTKQEIETGNRLGYPLSDAQRRLWVLSQFQAGSIAYNMSGIVKLKGSYNRDLFQQSFEFLIERHESLRTVFKPREDQNEGENFEEVRQWIIPTDQLKFNVEFYDFTNTSNPKNEAKKYCDSQAEIAFDLARGPLLKASLLQLSATDYSLFFNIHHIISDGWSIELLSKELFDCYGAFKVNGNANSVEINLSELRIQYKDYTVWQNDQLQNDAFAEDKNYWLNQLAGDLPLLNLPATKQRPILKTNSGYKLLTSVNPETTRKLSAYTHENGGSLFMGILAVWNILMYRYSGQKDLIIGTPVSGREHVNLENLIGCFINTLALRNSVNPEESFHEFFIRIKESTLESFNHQKYPFDRLVEELDMVRDTSRSAVFDVLLVFQNKSDYSRSTQFETGQINEIGTTTSKFDITITFEEQREGLSMELIYNPDIYDLELIEGLMRHFKLALEFVLDRPHTKIDQIDFLTTGERNILLNVFNNTHETYPANEGLLDLFEKQVRKTPEKEAVWYETNTLSYRQLDDLSNQLADYLKHNYDIQANDLISIKQERTEWIIISVLAVLKSGGAFVAIDPQYPEQRKDFIERDTNCKVCLDETEITLFKASKTDYSLRGIEKNSETRIAGDQLAYIIYTSGSTGTPKGVMITHQNVYAFIKWCHVEFLNSEFDELLFTTSLNFDLSIFEIFYPLTTGKKLRVLKSGLEIPNNVNSKSKLMINTVPSVIGSLLDQGMSFNQVSILNMAGEPIPLGYKKQLIGKVNEIRNLYGPSEDTTYSTVYRIDENLNDLIGKPISNTEIYIVNKAMSLQPIGVTGEICISGSGLAKGYLNRDSLTADKFIQNPFKSGERLYKTGDLGKWLSDGNIAYLGRKDDQVKIRGYRIELGEIEYALNELTAIEQVTVIARVLSDKSNQIRDKELVAYFTAKETQDINEIRGYLKERLPSWMVPGYFVQLDAMPQTPNGKIDKEALLNPTKLNLDLGAVYTAPTCELERQLVEIWSDVLQIDKIGINTDFFSLGGQSLKAIRVLNQYRRQFNCNLSLEDLFKHVTIAAQSQLIQTSKKVKFLSIPKVNTREKEGHPVSFAQKRLWVLSQFEGSSIAYNTPGRITIHNRIDVKLFNKAINAVVERHEILRTVFQENENGELCQWVLPKTEVLFELDYLDLVNEKNQISELERYVEIDSHKPFDLAKGPLMRVALIQLEEDKCILYLNMHHIISDNWSMEVLFKDTFLFYEAYMQNKVAELPILPIQYNDFTIWQLDQIQKGIFDDSRIYWLNQLSGELPLLELPSNGKRPNVKTYNGKTLLTSFDSETSTRLKEYSSENGGSLFMGLLATLNVLLYKYTAQRDIIVGSPVTGREHVDLENQIGFYLNTLALRNEIDSAEDFNSFFKKVKDVTLSAYNHQLYPFDKLVDELNLTRDTSRSGVFDVMLVLKNKSELFTEKVVSNTDEIIDMGSKTSKFDLLVNVEEQGTNLAFTVEYNTDIYNQELIEQFIRHYKTLTSELVSNPNKILREINCLTREESDELINDFNNTNVSYPAKSVMTLFEEQVIRTPEKEAIEFNGEILTYRMLNQKCNQLANNLNINFNIDYGSRVGVMLERSINSVIAMIGVMKTGACYVPIDPDYPTERINYIIKDSGIDILIGENLFFDKHEVDNKIRFVLSELNFEENDGENLPKPSDSPIEAYVIYTSGSTGRPKGVLQTHKMMTNLVQWELNHSGIDRELNHLQFTSFSFDVSLQDFWSVLCAGGKLHIADRTLRIDLTALWNYIVDHQIEVISFPYSAFQQFIIQNSDRIGKNFPIKHFISSGEQLIVNPLIEKILELNPQLTLHNHYGPSETHVVTYHKMSKELGNIENRSSIGRPISNSSIFLLDENQKLVPKGVIGEIYIGGKNLALNYLNQVELSKSKFIENPFEQDSRLYRTGDLARWMPNGNLDFLGRIDDQVKVNGYRVELGEIEHALSTLNDIKEGVVLIKESKTGLNELIAYVTSNTDQKAHELRGDLKKIIPEFMIPTRFFQVDQMPLTSNGKVNKQYLLDLKEGELSSGIEYIAPRNEIETKLVEIWETVLDRCDIGIDEGFFEAGGNSIKLVALKSAIKKELTLECSLVSLFQYTTIRQQANFLAQTPEGVESDLQFELSESGSTNIENDIAVIGMSIKCPGATNITEFWESLRAGREMITHFSKEELAEKGVNESLINNPRFVKANSYLHGKENFDAAFFGYMPPEAKLMDPQTRVFHEIVWSAIEDSGYDPIDYKGRIGLYAGSGNNLEWETYSHLTNDGKVNDFIAHQLSDRNFGFTLIAHKLNLKGSANAIETACSTSLVAIHHAAKSVITGENHMAVAGGISIRNTNEFQGYMHEEGMILSSDGHNRTFDHDASGTVESEGGGAVVLKKLSAAIKDGDQIYAIIKGSAINNDGNRKVGYTAPSVEGQTEAIRLAQLVANVSPNSVSYIEAHGTATSLGDPIEVMALKRAFGQSETQYCAIGSVKSNVGHLGAGAGVTGFIKAVLCLKNKELVPSLHYNKANSEIEFNDSPFYVNTELKKWNFTGGPLRAGVSSFGIGGTNAHIVLEEPPYREKELGDSTKLQILTLSAKTAQALINQQENLKEFLERNQNLNLSDVAYTLSNRRDFPFRTSIVSQSIQEAVKILEKRITSNQTTVKEPARDSKVVFMFSGSGMQYTNMGLDLYNIQESVFRLSMDRCFEIAAKYSDVDFKEIIYPTQEEQTNKINETQFTQPLLFMLQYALSKQMESIGVRPSSVIGHSTGDFAAACFCGIFDLEDAIKLIIKRGALMQTVEGGAMLAVEIPAEKVINYLVDGIDIAVINTPGNCILSGNHDSIQELSKHLNNEGVDVRDLHISCPAHSAMMEPILIEFSNFVATVEIHAPNIPYISNLTGSLINEYELSQKDYWSRHIRETVMFSRGINNVLSENENHTFIEIGPGNSLCNAVLSHLEDHTNCSAHSLVRHPKHIDNDERFLLNKIAELWEMGVAINWEQLQSKQAKNKITMPTYAFERVRYPLAIGVQDLLRNGLGTNKYKRRDDLTEWFYERSWKRVRLISEDVEIEPCDYLVFCHEDELSMNLIDKLLDTEKGRVVTVKIGQYFEQNSESSFTINPHHKADYIRLFNQLDVQQSLPDKIFHMWNHSEVVNDLFSVEKIEKDLEFGYYSLLNLAVAIGVVCPFSTIGLNVISNQVSAVNNRDETIPAKSTILGPVLTIPKEYNSIHCRHIDISDKEDVLNLLIQEIYAPYDVSEIAYRNGSRWVQYYEQVKLKPSKISPAKLKNGGVYLITGGMGGMGFVFANYLKTSFDAKLILTGRKPMSEDISEKLALLGDKAIYIDADVSDTERMEAKLKEAELKWGEINGIIHTTGIPDRGGIIQNREKEQSEKVFDSKIYGTMVVSEIASIRALDFLVLCSSAAAGMAPFGEVAYTAANTFQDSLARSAKKAVIQSIGWDAWYETGMGIQASASRTEKEINDHLGHGMSNEEGVEVLNRILRSGIPSVSVSTRDVELLYLVDEPESNQLSNEPKIVQNRPVMSNDYLAPETETEKLMSAFLEEFFGIIGLGVNDNLFELGMDSLKAMKIINHFHELFDVKLKINDVLEEPNMYDLGKKIDSIKNIGRMQETASDMQFEHEIEI